MAPTQNQARIDIGPYRKLRLGDKPNAGGYWVIFWSDARKGYTTQKHSTNRKDIVQAKTYFDGFVADCRAEVLAEAAASAGPKRPPAIERLCELWLNAVEKDGKARTGRNVLSSIRQEFGHFTPDQLDRMTLREYGPGYAQGTIRRNLGALRTVLIWAKDEGLISANDIPVFKKVLPKSGPPRQLFLDPLQEAWFHAEAQRWGDPTRWTSSTHADLEAAAAYRIALFVAIGLDTAARREAILDLTWDRVDLVLGMIDFAKPGRRVTPKSRPRVPIAKRLMPILKAAWLKAPKDAAGRATGLVIGTGDIGRPFRKFTAAIGVTWVTPHVLRHTWGSLRAMEGVSLWDIAKGMGDAVKTVEDNYLHLTPDHLKKAFKA